MKHIKYSISSDIFAKHPGYFRIVMLIDAANNSAQNPYALEVLRHAEAEFSERYTLESLASEPRIDNWRRAFRAMGVNPNETRPSHDAIGRRISQRKLLPDINPIVNIANAISLLHVIPVGAHPIHEGHNEVVLRHASGDERFVPFGNDAVERPRRGEIILVSNNDVSARCWVWRQGKHSITLPTTSALFINIDCLPPVSVKDAEFAWVQAEGLLHRHCGAPQITIRQLTALTPSFEMDLH